MFSFIDDKSNWNLFYTLTKSTGHVCELQLSRATWWTFDDDETTDLYKRDMIISLLSSPLAFIRYLSLEMHVAALRHTRKKKQPESDFLSSTRIDGRVIKKNSNQN